MVTKQENDLARQRSEERKKRELEKTNDPFGGMVPGKKSEDNISSGNRSNRSTGEHKRRNTMEGKK